MAAKVVVLLPHPGSHASPSSLYPRIVDGPPDPSGLHVPTFRSWRAFWLGLASGVQGEGSDLWALLA